MTLSVVLDGQRLSAAEIAIERAIGRAVTWRCLIRVAPDVDLSTSLSQLAGALAAGSCRLSASIENSSLVQDAIVTGAQFRDETRLLEVEAHTTRPGRDADIFTPRRRVHRVQTWRQLIDRLDNVATAALAVRNHLEQYQFPSGNHTSIVQDDESDWEFLGRAVSQFARFEKAPPLARLAVVGGNDPSGGSAERWVLNWACGAGYEQVQDVRARHHDGPEPDAHTSLLFSALSHSSAHTKQSPTGQAPLVRYLWRDRPFDDSTWRRWVERDAPVFIGAENLFAWRIYDAVAETGQPGMVSWRTEFTIAPTSVPLRSPLPSPDTTAWIGAGTVTRTSKRGPWVEVVLDGFESGDDRVDARIMTPYGGTDNTKGLHFVPENGTPVALGWSGRLMDPLLVIGNVRDQASSFASPAVWLESTLTSQYVDIACKSVGQVSIDSDLSMSVDGLTQLKSDRPINLTGDGCNVELRGGTFYTGSGM